MSPKYDIVGLLGAVTVALYTMQDVLHSPFRGHGAALLQLHEVVCGAVRGSGDRTLALWELIIAPIFGIQL